MTSHLVFPQRHYKKKSWNWCYFSCPMIVLCMKLWVARNLKETFAYIYIYIYIYYTVNSPKADTFLKRTPLQGGQLILSTHRFFTMIKLFLRWTSLKRTAKADTKFSPELYFYPIFKLASGTTNEDLQCKHTNWSTARV